MPPKHQNIQHQSKTDLGKVFPNGVRIGKTSYGLGVFTFAFVEKGTPIARVAGTVIHDPNYSSDYCIDLGDDKVLEPDVPFCYLNHACVPNCQLTHYVKEADAEESDETLPVGELTEGEMDLENESQIVDDDAIYSDEDEPVDVDYETSDDESDSVPALSLPSDFSEDADAEIWVEALRDIMPNEELTIDYSWPADRAAKCLCGHPQCRGWIVDPAERELLPGDWE